MGAVFSAIAPVFVVAGAAFALRRWFHLDVRTLSTLNIYLFVPCLVFSGLSKRVIEWPLFGRFLLATTLMLAALTLILSLIARARRADDSLRGAFLLTMFPNLGNFGLPVVLFAFGETARPLAVVVLVCGSLFQNSYGVYLAQRNRHSVGVALLRVFRFPLLYAFVLALVVQRLDLPAAASLAWLEPLVTSISRAIDITADAAIPAQLMILGAKLAETRLERGPDVFLASFVRLAVTPPLAFAVTWLVGLEGLDAKVFILQVSGPIAVGMAAYGVQFEVNPRFLASAVTWTFLFSIVTVSALLFVLIANPL